jgi:hypothetical protein
MSELFDAGIEHVPAVTTEKDEVEVQKDELKKELAPLSEAEADAVHEAFALGKEEPAAANEDDSTQTGWAPLLPDVYHVATPSTIVTANNGLGFGFIVPSDTSDFHLDNSQINAFRFDASLLKAANDVANLNEAFTTFESTLVDTIVKENSLSVKVKTEGNKTHYLFEKQANKPVVLATVFDMAGRKMVKITNIILPLSQLLTLEKCVSVDKPVQKEGKADLRGNPLFEQGKVECTFADGEVIQINDIDVGFMMEIVAHLSSIHEDNESEYESDNDTEEKATAPLIQHVVLQQPFFTEPIKERLISLITGAVITGFGIWFGRSMV